MIRNFEFRIYPNKQQTILLFSMLEKHRVLYNAALEERMKAWKYQRISVSKYDQCNQLKYIRQENSDYSVVNSASMQRTLANLDLAFKAFFSRIKKGEKSGYPHFKGKRDFKSFTFTYGNGVGLKGNKIYLQHIGLVKMNLHRSVEENIKTCTIKLKADGWYAIFSCDLGDVKSEPSTNPSIGIDLGLKVFLAISDGDFIESPRYFRNGQRKLRRSQRSASRKQKGSNRRKKAQKIVAKNYQHISNQRKDFHHKIARSLVNKYGTIFIEDLNVKGLSRGILSKSVNDAGWGNFIRILESKAETVGVQVIKVNPNNTSQTCSNCGCLPSVKLGLSDRIYNCEHCGYQIDRDHNAAINILNRGSRLQKLT